MESRGGLPLKILLIDDSIDDRKLFKALLSRTSINSIVLEAEEGLEGLEICRKEKPDCLLLDYNLPDMDGLEFINELTQEHELMPITTIMLTGQGSEDIAVQSMKLGIQDYLVKGKVTATALERALLNAVEKLSMQYKIERQHQQMLDELEQARITQLTLLPNLQTKLPEIELAAKYIPIEKIGGDLYDIIDFKKEKLGIFIADVVGHGVSAALLSFLISGLFRTFAPEVDSPATVLKTLNDSLVQKIAENKFVTSFYCIYDSQTRTLTYSSAGHPAGYVIQGQNHHSDPLRGHSSQIVSIRTDGLMLGAFQGEQVVFEEGNKLLSPGDKVVLFTDGLTETKNAEGQLFGSDALENILLQFSHLSINELLEAVYSEIVFYSKSEDHPEGHFEDDLTLVGFTVT